MNTTLKEEVKPAASWEARAGKSCWKLYFNGKAQHTLRGPDAMRTLQAQAALLNERKAVPSKASLKAAPGETPDMFPEFPFQPKPRATR